jgi:Flp pilus assembly protein TadD
LRFRLLFVFLLASAFLPGASTYGSDHRENRLELRGRVVIPQKLVQRGRRIAISVVQVGTSFSERTWADFKGRFRFRKLPAGTYSMLILIPGTGEIQTTVDVTSSFADSRGRVERDFQFDEKTLAEQARPAQQGLVSVRELSIPRKARREYDSARKDLQRQRLESARRRLQKALEIAPQFMEALNTLGVMAFQQRDYATAERYFRQALEIDDEAFEPLVNLGGTLLALGQSEEAILVNGRAHAMRPGDALASAQLGLSYYMAGNDQEALNYLLLTEQIDPAHFSNPQLTLARIYLQHSEEEAALEELQDFLERRPDSPEASQARRMIERVRSRMEAEGSRATGSGG